MASVAPPQRPRPMAALAGLLLVGVIVLVGVVATVVQLSHNPGSVLGPGSDPAQPVTVNPHAPDLRAAAAAYNVGGREAVLFGGEDSASHSLHHETWTWDGSSWLRHEGAGAPPARTDGVMVEDMKDDQMLLLGGTGADRVRPLQDMWAWQSLGWRRLADPAPHFAGLPAAAWDPVGDRLLVVAPVQNGGELGTETWSWDGVGWTQLRPIHEPRFGGRPVMTDDPGHAQMVLVAGEGRGVRTWRFTAGDWTLGPGPGPGTGYDPAKARVATSAAGEVILISEPARTWIWDGGIGTWVPAAETPVPWHGSLLSAGGVLLLGGASAGSELGQAFLWRAGTWSPRPAAASLPQA